MVLLTKIQSPLHFQKAQKGKTGNNRTQLNTLTIMVMQVSNSNASDFHDYIVWLRNFNNRFYIHIKSLKAILCDHRLFP